MMVQEANGQFGTTLSTLQRTVDMRFTGLETRTARLDASRLALESRVEELTEAVKFIMTFLNTPQHRETPFSQPSSTMSQSISHLIT